MPMPRHERSADAVAAGGCAEGDIGVSPSDERGEIGVTDRFGGLQASGERCHRTGGGYLLRFVRRPVMPTRAMAAEDGSGTTVQV